MLVIRETDDGMEVTYRPQKRVSGYEPSTLLARSKILYSTNARFGSCQPSRPFIPFWPSRAERARGHEKVEQLSFSGPA